MTQYHIFSNSMIERAKVSVNKMARQGVVVPFRIRSKKSGLKHNQLTYRYKGVVAPKKKGVKDGFCLDAEKKLQSALRLIAQTPVGQVLIQRSFCADYSFVFNDKKLKAADSGGFCNPSTKLIELPTDISVAHLALTIVHEMAHASQFEQSSLVLYEKSMQDPKFYLSLFYAIEADARAQELLFALEYTESLSSKRKAKDDSAGNPVLNALKQNYPLLTDVGMQKLFQHQGLTEDAKREALQAAFLAFYNCKGLRLFYEGIYVNDVIEKRDANFDQRFVDLRPNSVRSSGRDIVKALNNQAPHVYLGDQFDLSDRRFFAVSREGHSRIAAKYGWEQANKLDVLEEDSLVDRGLGGYVKDAANAFFKGCETSLLKYAIDTMDARLFKAAMRQMKSSIPVIGRSQEHFLLYAIRRMGYFQKSHGDEGAEKARKFFKTILKYDHAWAAKQKSSGLSLLEQTVASIAVFGLQDICKNELARFFKDDLTLAKKAFKVNKVFRIYATKHHRDILDFWRELLPPSIGSWALSRVFK